MNDVSMYDYDMTHCFLYIPTNNEYKDNIRAYFDFLSNLQVRGTDNVIFTVVVSNMLCVVYCGVLYTTTRKEKNVFVDNS